MAGVALGAGTGAGAASAGPPLPVPAISQAVPLGSIDLPLGTDFSITGFSEIGSPLSRPSHMRTLTAATRACGPVGDGAGSTSVTENER